MYSSYCTLLVRRMLFVTSPRVLRCVYGMHVRPQRSQRPHLQASTNQVQVVFTDANVKVVAQPGQPISEVASACGVDLHYGCFTGSCGVCEMELRKFDGTGKEGGSVIVRTCVAVVPSEYHTIKLEELQDAVWGMDGFDT